MSNTISPAFNSVRLGWVAGARGVAELGPARAVRRRHIPVAVGAVERGVRAARRAVAAPAVTTSWAHFKASLKVVVGCFGAFRRRFTTV